jgi:FkbM family methyltransferase
MNDSVSPVLDLVRCSRLTRVVDIGANLIEGEPSYKPMLDAKLCRVIGLEPQQDALAELLQRRGPLENYLPYAVGDGGKHRLTLTGASGMASLFRPDPKRLALFNGFTDWGVTKGEVEISTQRLDDIEEIGEFDLLTIDIQGGELMAFQNGREKLQQAVAVQTEVSFVPLYEKQPVFGQVDLELRSQGFLPHSFKEIKRWSISPTIFAGNFCVGQNQLLEADIVYVRDIAYPERLTDEQLSHLAMIAFHVYGSVDLAHFCIRQLSQRGCTSAQAGVQFLDRIEQ